MDYWDNIEYSGQDGGGGGFFPMLCFASLLSCIAGAEGMPR